MGEALIPSRVNTADELRRLRDQHRQLLLIDSHEGAGNVTPETASRYRLHVLRGGSIFGLPMDGPNAARCVSRWQKTERALRQDGRLHLLRQLRLEALPCAPQPRRGAARSPRRRSVRRAASRARGPDDPLGSEPPLGVAARAEVQRILDAEARRILATRLEGDAIVPASGSDEGTLEDGLDDPAPAFEAQAVPISGSVENDSGSIDAL